MSIGTPPNTAMLDTVVWYVESLHLILDLHGELARGRQHERPRPRRLRRGLVEETLEDGDQERRRLTGSGFRARDHVAARERHRNHAALDGPCLCPSEIADSAQQPHVE